MSCTRDTCLSDLTVAVDVAGLGGVGEPRALAARGVWVRIQTLRHFFTNHIH